MSLLYDSLTRKTLSKFVLESLGVLLCLGIFADCCQCTYDTVSVNQRIRMTTNSSSDTYHAAPALRNTSPSFHHD